METLTFALATIGLLVVTAIVTMPAWLLWWWAR